MIYSISMYIHRFHSFHWFDATKCTSCAGTCTFSPSTVPSRPSANSGGRTWRDSGLCRRPRMSQVQMVQFRPQIQLHSVNFVHLCSFISFCQESGHIYPLRERSAYRCLSDSEHSMYRVSLVIYLSLPDISRWEMVRNMIYMTSTSTCHHLLPLQMAHNLAGETQGLCGCAGTGRTLR